MTRRNGNRFALGFAVGRRDAVMEPDAGMSRVQFNIQGDAPTEMLPS